MGSKLAAVLDDQMDFGVDRIPGLALEDGDSGHLFPSVAPLEKHILTLSDSEHMLQLKTAEWHKSNNYQVALVPLGNKVDREGKRSQAPRNKPVLVLPLTWRELLVRLRSGVSRSGSGRESSVVRFGDVCVDFSSMEVSRSNETVALTGLEFRLLRFLVQNAGRVISRDELLDQVWGYENYPCTRTVDNHILRLRQKLELDPARPVHFHTVHGVGYKFVLKTSRTVPEHKM